MVKFTTSLMTLSAKQETEKRSNPSLRIWRMWPPAWTSRRCPRLIQRGPLTTSGANSHCQYALTLPESFFLRFTINGDFRNGNIASGCWAYVGKQGGEQVINLTPPDCHTREVVTHEVMHSLGVFHEHNRWEVNIGKWNVISSCYSVSCDVTFIWISSCLSHPQTLQVLFLPLTRPDRDEHVRVLMENIQEENKQNFEKREYKMGEVEELVTPYDIYREERGDFF